MSKKEVGAHSPTPQAIANEVKSFLNGIERPKEAAYAYKAITAHEALVEIATAAVRLATSLCNCVGVGHADHCDAERLNKKLAALKLAGADHE